MNMQMYVYAYVCVCTHVCVFINRCAYIFSFILLLLLKMALHILFDFSLRSMLPSFLKIQFTITYQHANITEIQRKGSEDN